MHPWIHLNDLETTAKKISSVFFDEYFVKFGTVSNNIGILSSNHACFDKKNLHDKLKKIIALGLKLATNLILAIMVNVCI